jgi:hypothetical protein
MGMDTFVCPRHPGELTLSHEACAGLYRRSRRAAAWDAARLCRGCEIGAAANAPPAKDAHPPPARPTPRPRPTPAPPSLDLDLDTRCCWCGKSGDGRRLVCDHLLCVPCANRLYEVARDAHRRGKPAGMATRLRVFVFEVVTP